MTRKKKRLPDQPLAPAAVRRVRLARPPCTLGITDGSERGDYVPQQHLLAKIGRPHHLVNLMFQYYPDLEGWPTQGVKRHGFYRHNDLNKGDGYFPLVLEEGGPWGQAYLRQIEDVRAYGQEPQLTLTLHADTDDATLIRIAKSLAPFAPMRIRINHECNGTWFYFNQRWSYGEVSDFFIRFHNILHEHAPGAKTVACWNGPGDAPQEADDGNEMHGMLTEDQLAPMFRTADIVSFDQYASLHYGWPDPDFDPANPTQFFKVPMDRWWKLLEECHDLMCGLRGGPTDIEVHEINEDADVVGFDEQARWVTRFYTEVVRRRLPWLTNITFYHFRDRGGLGLEHEDPDDPSVFRDLRSLHAYRRAAAHEYFGLRIEPAGAPAEDAPLAMEWRSPAAAQGYQIEYDAPRHARLAAVFPAAAHLLVGAGEQWFIKPAGQERLELPAADGRVVLRVFAPPPDGRNNRADRFTATLDHAPPVSAS